MIEKFNGIFYVEGEIDRLVLGDELGAAVDGDRKGGTGVGVIAVVVGVLGLAQAVDPLRGVGVAIEPGVAALGIAQVARAGVDGISDAVAVDVKEDLVDQIAVHRIPIFVANEGVADLPPDDVAGAQLSGVTEGEQKQQQGGEITQNLKL